MTREDDLQTIKRRARRSASSLREYLKFVIDITPARHQDGWLEACQDIGDKASGQRYCIIAPPGAGKSVFIGVGFMSWIIGKNPNSHYGMLSYADQVAWDRALPIRNIIEHSKAFKLTFPDVEPDNTAWDKKGFRVQRPNLADPHPTLRAGGVSSAVVSYRLSGLTLDDVLDVKTAATARAREKVYDDYVDAVSTRMVKYAWQLCIGTRWSDDDFIGRLLALRHHGAPVWTPIHVPAILPDSTSYWPEEYPIETLKEKQDTMPSNFAIQYQGDTTGGSTQIIRKMATYEEYPKDADGKVDVAFARPPRKMPTTRAQEEENRFRKDLVMGASWDTALKDKQENDYSVMYIGGLDKHGNIWVVDREKERFVISEIVALSKAAYLKWRTMGIWFEDSTVGTPAVTTIREEMPLVPCDTVYYSGGKRSRANVLAQYIHNGQVRFPKWAGWFPDCEYYLKHFPHTDHDDDIDSLFVLVDNLLQMRHPAEYEDRPRVGLVMR
jgi:predicted phage terminase large subunit-like protein